MKKILIGIFLLITLTIVVSVLWLLWFNSSIAPKVDKDQAIKIEFTAERFLDQPIIFEGMDATLIEASSKDGYNNINGPCLIRVPDWIENPLGQYYLYFAHHKGSYIRMAYADSIAGPWTIYKKGTLQLTAANMSTKASAPTGLRDLLKYTSLSEAKALYDIGSATKKAFEDKAQNKTKVSAPTTPHIASPEIHIDHETKQIRMYYHGIVDGSLQMTKVALSGNGLDFEAKNEILGLPYMRVFKHQNEYFGLAMPGFLYRSKDGLSNFEVRKRWLFDTDIRHTGLFRKGDDLYIFYTKVGDQPEQIYVCLVDISAKDWSKWKAGPSYPILKPKEKWEGVQLPIKASIRGESGIPVHQLRDPYIFQDIDNRLYLLYAGAGEQAIGIVNLRTN